MERILKSIKEIAIVFLIFVLIFIAIKFYDLNKKKSEIDSQIKIAEKEKAILKKQVEIKEKIVIKSEAEIKKIRVEKEDILKGYKSELEHRDIVIKNLSNTLTDKRKEIIKYKSFKIKKDAPKDEIWNFTINLKNDFFKYVDLDIIERKKTDETISGLKKIVKDLKTMNYKSESIVLFEREKYQTLKKKNKKIIIISAIVIVLTIIILK